MNNMTYIKNQIIKSLSILDNSYVNFSIVIILILYCSLLFTNINKAGGLLYNSVIVRFIVLLLISYLAHKDTNIAILLAIAYLISVKYMSISEKFDGMDTSLNYSNLTESEMNEMPSYEGSMQETNEMPSYERSMQETNEMPSYEGSMQEMNEMPSYEGSMQEMNEMPSYEGSMQETNEMPSYERSMQETNEMPSYEGSMQETNEMPSYEGSMQETNEGMNENNYNIIENYDDLVKTQERNDVLNSVYPPRENYISRTISSEFKNSNKKCRENLKNTKNNVITKECNSVATFHNELNAQGMNYPSGFNIDDKMLGFKLEQNYMMENFDIAEKLKANN
jgi:hypothetical protein